MTGVQPQENAAPVVVGVLALQGDFKEHIEKLTHLGVKAVEIRTPQELSDPSIVGLILPGGESTTISLLASKNGLLDAMRDWVAANKPTFGTCAGLILMSNKVTRQCSGGQSLVGGLDILVDRNYFGSQLDSFEMKLEVQELRGYVQHDLAQEHFDSGRATFIRAPAVLQCGENVETLATCSGPTKATSVAVAVRQGRLLGIAFHPELTDGDAWHRYFLHIVSDFVNTSRLSR